MTDHPITPTPELLQQWAFEYWGKPGVVIGNNEKYIAILAARWGADQELEACCEWLRQFKPQGDVLSAQLRAARHPKPQSLAQEALDAWDRLRNETWCQEIDFDLDQVRRALERLQELEGQGDD